MDGSSLAGNPSTSPSSPPAHADKETRQTAEKNQQNTDSGTLSRSEVHQGLAEAKGDLDQPDITKHTKYQDLLMGPQKSGEPARTKTDSLLTEQQEQGPEKNQELGDSPVTNQPNSEQTFPAKPAQINVDPIPTEQQKPGATENPKTKDSPSTNLPNPALLRPGDLLSLKHEPKQEQEQDHQTQAPEQHPINPMTDLTGFSSSLNEQKPKDLELHTSEARNQQNHHDPDPPPLVDQQNHPSHSDILTSATHTSEALTMPPPAPPITIEAFCDPARPHTPMLSSVEPKLCGFLQKQGGPLRAWKERWFTYEEKKNQLFYYRTPQDVTPLGRVELSSATFTYPLKAEKGTFHINTPERTFILKAITQELMHYWLQQLQVKRWRHRQTSTCPEPGDSSTTEHFLPLLKSPLGLVGEGAVNARSQRTPLANMSIKHPLIELQNSVHSLRKRSSQEWSQSVFHTEATSSATTRATAKTTASTTTTTTASTTASTTTSTTSTTASTTASTTTSTTSTTASTTASTTTNTHSPRTPRTVDPVTPPVFIPLADPAGQVSPIGSRASPSLSDSWNRKMKRRSSSTMPARRRDTMSSDRTSRLQQEKQMLMEEVKAQKELVWILHKALEAAQLEKRTCAEFLAEKGEQERLELLRHRERQAADLQGRLEEATAEVEEMRRGLAQKDAQLAELQENIRILTEKNDAKREVIIKLSDQVTACLSETPRLSFSSGLDSQTFSHLHQEIENLKDDIEAYKTQNRFLNSEIHQLTGLWRTSSEQEKSLMVKCAYLEANHCQVESRYLGILRKLQENKSLDPAQRGAVQKMIADALKGELKSVVKLNTARDHDEYGFKIIPDYEVEDMKLLAKIQALEIRSHNLLHQEGVDRPLLSRWAQYLAGRSDNDLCPSPELKGLMRGGVPQEYRQRVWCWVVRARTRTIRDRHPQHYQQLCDKSRTSPHPASRQIQLDLHRTLTTNQHFSSPSSPALQQLCRILLAFSWHNPTIGYCQGLNRLAAIALLILQNEEDAFWCLVAVVEAMMPQDYYTKNLVASQADQRVLKDFLAEKLPRLAAHFEDHSIDVSLITFNWFLVVFVESLPSDILLPLWDAFLYEGTKVIFRYALALFKYKEDDILKIHDGVEIYQYLRFFTKTISDSRKLTTIAFSDMNPFPGRLLKNRRAFHLERLHGELQEMEEQQREFVTESAERKDKELDTIMVSEDDEEL